MKEQNEKQAIEEMADIVHEAIEKYNGLPCRHSHCKFKDKPVYCDECESVHALYDAGYRKQSVGAWILTGTFKSTFPLPVADLHISCSVCGWEPPKYSDDYKEYNFCPNCGARMKGGAE